MIMRVSRPYKRSDRLADEIKSIIATLFITDFQIKDSGLLTISKVKVTSDLRMAKIYISLLAPKKNPDDIIKNIDFNKKNIRYQLGKSLNAKYVPELSFFYDDNLKHAEKIGTLLTEIRNTEQNKS